MSTTVTAPADLPVVRIEREFDAPAERVQRAHTDPELFARWVGPHALGTRIDHWDARTGGSWRYTALRGGEEHGFYGSFHEIRPGRVVQTFTYAGVPDEVSLETMTLTDLPGGRCRLESVAVFGSMPARDGMVASGMESGVSQGHEKLDALLAEDPA